MVKKVIIYLTAIFISCSACAEGLKPIKLPAPDKSGGKPLMQALKERQSSRSFSPRELSNETLSNLLWAAFGVNRPESGMRTAPSAHNTQEIDTYVALKQGLYLYDAISNTLEPVMAKDIREYTGLQGFTQVAPVNLIFVVDYTKMSGNAETDKFYSAVDTGYISQNVYLFCSSEGLSTVVLGWVDRPALAKIMGLKSTQEIILTQPVGYSEK